jgi:integrase
VRPGGTKTFFFRYTLAGRQQRIRLGPWPAITLEVARSEAARYCLDVMHGQAPAQARAARERSLRHPITLEAFAERWVAEVVSKVRKDPRPIERMLRREVLPHLGSRPISTISDAEVQELVFRKRDLGRPEAAAALRHLLKRLFDYARVCREIEANPVDSTPLKFVVRHKARTRALSEAELRLFLARLDSPRLGPKMGLVLELILLTLCRKSELMLARWEHVHFDTHTWEVPAELSKSGLPHIVYLSPRAEEIFRMLSNAVLAGSGEGSKPQKDWYALPAQNSRTQPLSPSALNLAITRVDWGMPHFTPHDLRRTGSTLLNEQGYPADWIEKALNHTVKGVRGVYNRAQYAEQRRQMLAEWAARLEKLKSGTETNQQESIRTALTKPSERDERPFDESARRTPPLERAERMRENR